jgi:hypothetical protein
MAFFTLQQNIKICSYCKISLSQIPQLVVRESYAYYTLGLGDDLVAEVEAILTELATLDAQSASYGSDKNALLTRADTLEWDIKSGGFPAMTAQRRMFIIDRLAGLLSIGELIGCADDASGLNGYGAGCTPLMRS